ncbi:MAG: ChbG/HpnK family deacetylase [Dehalococcoidia bacterium]
MTKTLELLRFAPDDRVRIIHADDRGFSHASNVAAFEAMERGSLTCASMLVPAPWFMETANLARQHPAAMAPNDCAHRAKEYEIFRTPDMRTYCESIGVRPIGYREIRDRLRASLGAAV